MIAKRQQEQDGWIVACLMQSSSSDKIAVILAWVLVHTAIGIGFMHVYALISDAIIMVLAYVVNFYVSYK